MPTLARLAPTLAPTLARLAQMLAASRSLPTSLSAPTIQTPFLARHWPPHQRLPAASVMPVCTSARCCAARFGCTEAHALASSPNRQAPGHQIAHNVSERHGDTWNARVGVALATGNPFGGMGMGMGMGTSGGGASSSFGPGLGSASAGLGGASSASYTSVAGSDPLGPMFGSAASAGPASASVFGGSASTSAAPMGGGFPSSMMGGSVFGAAPSGSSGLGGGGGGMGALGNPFGGGGTAVPTGGGSVFGATPPQSTPAPQGGLDLMFGGGGSLLQPTTTSAPMLAPTPTAASMMMGSGTLQPTSGTNTNTNQSLFGDSLI